MKFSRYTRRRKCVKRSPEYAEKRREELYVLLGRAKTAAERDALIDAYSVTMNPYRK